MVAAPRPCLGLAAQPVRHLPKLAPVTAVRNLHQPLCPATTPLLGLRPALTPPQRALRRLHPNPAATGPVSGSHRLCLALGGLIFLWRARPALPKYSPPTTPGRTAMPKGTPPAVEKVAASLPATLAQISPPQAEPSRPVETAASETFESTLVEPPSVVVDVPDFPEISPAFSAAPWAAVVAADLQNTQLAMIEASQDFMREPRIQP